jgi:triacylglycerol esterase/lipase EstA (alpha/beta hydrolase family)
MGRGVRAIAVAVAVALTAPVAARAADPPLDVPRDKLAAALTCPSAFTHPAHEPVLLVHGTGLDAEESWSWNYAKVLPAVGFDTCAVTLPEDALGDIQVATEYVVYAVERIRARSGRRVDVITHSQGGMEGRWAVRWWAGARNAVDDLVLLASPNHGIAAADLCAGSGNCWPAVWQMATASRFLAALNRGDETPGTVAYTNVYSRTDELVQPQSTVPLAGASNVAVQDVCPRPVHHGGLLDDAPTYALVLDALTHAGGADAQRIDPATCAQPFAPGISAADALAGNAMLYSDAAQAFSAHDGVPAEPPLKPYANR